MYSYSGRRCLAAAERAGNFREVEFGFSREEAIEEANRCLNCPRPECIEGCPAHVDIPAFVAAIREGNFQHAREIIHEQNVLPSICGRVCPQETQCEGNCLLLSMGKPLKIGLLERFIGDATKDKIKKPRKKSGKKAAVVGSGPAGITASKILAENGVSVTLFEAKEDFGGVLKYGIPEFRLPNQIVDTEIEKLKSLGVKLLPKTALGKDLSFKTLLSDFDFIVLCYGINNPNKLNIPGENLPGVLNAIEFLEALQTAKLQGKNPASVVELGKKVVVIGGGNVAIDAARVSHRLGCDVEVVYRKDERSMRARIVEIEHAKYEGIKFRFMLSPMEILADKDNKRLEAVKFSPSQEKYEQRILADSILVAIGQKMQPIPWLGSELKTDEKKYLVVDKNFQTSNPKVFAVGDCVFGASTVINAVYSARKAAETILSRIK